MIDVDRSARSASMQPGPSVGVRTGVAIAVATYKRPEELRLLLPLLEGEAATIDPPADVIVVDNDPAAGAREVVADTRCVYLHEPEPGIAAARNRALDHAVGYRHLLFIDDDEQPRPGWLRLLLDTIRGTGAAAVAGPVVSEFDAAPDPWVTASGLFQRRRWKTGTRVHAAATNNLVLDLDQTGSLRFDDRLGLIGGSDTMFTRQLIRAGGTIVWCDEAVVVDHVPSNRATRDWVKRRAYRIANSEVTVSLLLAATAHARTVIRARGLASGVGRMIIGAVFSRWGAIRGSLHLEAGGTRLLYRGKGRAAAALGATYAEYLRDAPAPKLRLRR